MMRALLVGAGGMGGAWAENLNRSPDVDLVSWIDVRPGVAAAAAEKRGISVPHTGTDLASALSEVSPDFVVDVTPPEVHFEVTMLALSRGIHVLGEKPMTDSMERARQMVRASEASGKLYMVSQSRRYDSGMTAFRRCIRERLGRLGILNVDFYIGAHFEGFRDSMEHVLLLDMAIHTFDQARYLSGADPISVYAEEFNPSWSWYKQDASANALFEMSDGLRFAYRGSWCSEGSSTSWEGDWRAVGEFGSAEWIKNRPPVAEVVKARGGFTSEVDRMEEPIIEVPSGIAGSLADFLSALRDSRVPEGECHDNIKSLAMVFAAVESAKRGERVMLAEMLS